jgi:hypothetical protein
MPRPRPIIPSASLIRLHENVTIIAIAKNPIARNARIRGGDAFGDKKPWLEFEFAGSV